MSQAPNLDTLTATAALAALHGGEYSVSDLARACLARIAAHNPRLNALISLTPAERVQAAAGDADNRLATLRRQGETPPPLLGLPISIKDAFATHDLPTTAGHPPLTRHQPTVDATAVTRLRAAGALLLGKSNLPELAGAPHCWNPLFGLTRNPWQPGLTPGGSSGGAAVAVAAGFSLLELGSDLAGSIRIPAAYCGVFGLKASEYRIPVSGHIPPLPGHGRGVRHALSLGVLARSVADLRLAYGRVAGPDGIDHHVPPLPTPAATAGPARPLRLALWDDFAGLPLCPHQRAAFSRAEARLRGAGHTVARIAAPLDVPLAWRAFGHLAGAEVGLGMPAWQRLILGLAGPLLPRADVLTRALGDGMRFNLRRYHAALQHRDALITELDACLAGYDALLCPVAPSGPYPGHPQPAHRPPPRLVVDGVALPYFQATLAMTTPFSLTGHPVVSLPLGIENGLPVGAQLVGRRWGEDGLLDVAAGIEAVLGGFVPPPLGA